MAIYVGNAPCSWGNVEWEDKSGSTLTFSHMLDELTESGYIGTELGDYGFMPTNPAALKRELMTRRLTMTGAFVPINFSQPAHHAEGETLALKTAQLIAAVASPNHPPFVVLADDCPHAPIRMQSAGRVTPHIMMSKTDWHIYAEAVNKVAKRVHNATGLKCVFHHHTGGLIETPAEIDTLLSLTDPAMVGLVFDTGHYSFGTGNPNSQSVMDALERYASRIWYVHYKDCQPDVAALSRSNQWDYHQSVQHGIFCELGKGCVPFDRVTQWLRERNYDGFVTVEQDVLPGMGTPKDSAQRNRDYLQTVCQL
jgi:inosose dehydratase